MQSGLFYEMEVRDYTEADIWHNALNQVEFAESLGFDAAYSVEHHFTPGYAHSSCPEIFVAAASQRTTTIRLGPGVCLLPFNNPIRTAERYGALDILCNGRLEMGVGRGATQKEFDTFDKPAARGETRDENRELFFEYIDVIKECWTQDIVQHQGKHFNMPHPLSVVPKPLQKPHPKLWAACGSPDSFELYPQRGIHIMAQAAVAPMANLEADMNRARKAWSDAGHGKDGTPLEAGCLIPVYCAETTDAAIEGMKEYELWYFVQLLNFFAPRTVTEVAGFSERTGSENRPNWWESPSWDYIYGEKMVICGDPDDCIETVKELEGYGINVVLGQFQVGGMPHDMVMKSIELWGKEVIPHIS